MGPLTELVEALLEEGAACGHKKTAGRCRNILGLRPALWTFVRVEGVEPTNNAAERACLRAGDSTHRQALRPAVLWRKGSFGSGSERGSRFVERMLTPARRSAMAREGTVAATCRQQGRNVLDYLVAACEAHLSAVPGTAQAGARGESAPSLVPQAAEERPAAAA